MRHEEKKNGQSKQLSLYRRSGFLIAKFSFELEFLLFFYSWQHEWKGCARVFSKPVQQDSNLNFVDIFAKLASSEYIIKLANSNSWITQRYFVSFNFTEKEISIFRILNPLFITKEFQFIQFRNHQRSKKCKIF